MQEFPHPLPPPDAPAEPFADKILDRIEKEHVVPAPRWIYVLPNALFWLLWIVSALAGAAAVAAAAFVLANAGWEFRVIVYDHWWRFMLDALPLIWISALVILMIAAYENMRHTSLGYRYPVWVVVGLNVLGSVVLGGVLYAAGIGERVEEGIGRRIPMHRSALSHQRVLWINPDRGLLAGRVSGMTDSGDAFLLRTYDGNAWTVSLINANARSRSVAKRFSDVRVVGVEAVISPTSTLPVFHACFIFPWVVQGMYPGTIDADRLSSDDLRDLVRSEDADALNAWPDANSPCNDIRPFDALWKLQERATP